MSDWYWTGDYIMDEVELGARVATRVTIERSKQFIRDRGEVGR